MFSCACRGTGPRLLIRRCFARKKMGVLPRTRVGTEDARPLARYSLQLRLKWSVRLPWATIRATNSKVRFLVIIPASCEPQHSPWPLCARGCTSDVQWVVDVVVGNATGRSKLGLLSSPILDRPGHTRPEWAAVYREAHDIGRRGRGDAC